MVEFPTAAIGGSKGTSIVRFPNRKEGRVTAAFREL